MVGSLVPEPLSLCLLFYFILEKITMKAFCVLLTFASLVAFCQGECPKLIDCNADEKTCYLDMTDPDACVPQPLCIPAKGKLSNLT
jgi:hypothetical protein